MMPKKNRYSNYFRTARSQQGGLISIMENMWKKSTTSVGSMSLAGQSVVAGVCALGLLSFAYFGVPFLSIEYSAGDVKGTATVADALEKSKEVPIVSARHIATPEPLKALYMTSCVAATPSLRTRLVGLAESSAINAIIIDIKDYSGTIAYHTGIPELEDATENAPGCVVEDMKAFVAELHAKGIYVIGRVTVFQDPYYAPNHPELAVQRASDKSVWKDRKGISFVDVSARPYWDYIITLAKTSYLSGFDEINFDYVRFPSDGNMTNIYFPKSNGVISANPENGKALALKAFFAYLSSALRDSAWLPEGASGPKLSADLFGMTTTNTDDLGIGQVLEYTLPYVDYVAPMVYPSHYPDGYNGYADPNAHSYDIIKYAMDKAVVRAKAIGEDPNKLRPWLQDFDYPVTYTPSMVSAQIQATYDAGLTSFMLWDPANTYTPSILND